MALSSVIRRRLAGDHVVDEWGHDPDLAELVGPLLRLRFDLDVSGFGHLPADGPALLVHDRRWGLSEPFVIGRAIRVTTGRHLRVAGVPDIAVLGPVLRRMGGVLDRPDEIGSVLRAGHMAAVSFGHRPVASDPGRREVRQVAAARSIGAPIHPVALVGHELGRRWRVEIGPEVPVTHSEGPLGDTVLAEDVRAAIDDLRDARGAV